jgi:hypothetical protein
MGNQRKQRKEKQLTTEKENISRRGAETQRFFKEKENSFSFFVRRKKYFFFSPQRLRVSARTFVILFFLRVLRACYVVFVKGTVLVTDRKW